MLSEPVHMNQPPSEEVWSTDQWNSSLLCDDFSQWAEAVLLPILQRYHLQEGASILKAFARSGLLSKVCQSVINQAFSMNQNPSNGLIHILSLLFNGEEARATHLLQEIASRQSVEDPADLLMISLIAQKTETELSWTPLKLLSAAEAEEVPGVRGAYYLLAAPNDPRSYDRALAFYDKALAGAEEEREQESLLAQRATVYLMLGDQFHAEKEMLELLKRGDLDSYISLYLALNWLSHKS